MRLEQLDQLARRQHGVIHRDQTDWSKSGWYRAIDAGSIIALHPNVARMVGTEPSEVQQICAAVHAVPGSIASHRSAAVLWDLVDADDDAEVHLTAPDAERDQRSLSGVTCHRPRDVEDVRPVTRQGVPATPPLRTLLDLGITDPDLVHAAVGRSLSAGLLTIDGLEAGLRRHAERGRTGVTVLRSAIDDWALDDRPADSVLELAFTDLCDRYGLPPIVFHEVLEGWEVDFRFVGTAVVVECDGWATHGRSRHQFETDRRKDDDLRAAGWMPMRLTYRAVTQQGADTARRLRRALDRWEGLPVPDVDVPPAA